jgi:flagellin
MATKNAQDATSLIQTAEGALNETESILQRMRELAVQSSNDTNTDADRKEIQKEISQLKDEVNRISTDTEFNTKKLLNGSVGNNANITATNALGFKNVSVTDSDLKADTYTVTVTAAGTLAADVKTNTTGIDATTFDYTDATTIKGLKLGDYSLEVKATGTAGTFDITLKNSDGVEVGAQAGWATGADIALTGKTPDGTPTIFTIADPVAAIKEGKMEFNLNATYAAGDFAITNSATAEVYSAPTGGQKITDNLFEAGGMEFDLSVDNVLATGASDITTTNNALSMHIGANENQTMKVDINKMDTDSLAIKDIDVTSVDGAERAITVVNDAITKVSAERSKLGAFQNRLDHTINNLGTSSENLTAAESRIRDVDMAKEMMTQTKNSILSQAAQAMLAQANQQPQSVLQLLQ